MAREIPLTGVPADESACRQAKDLDENIGESHAFTSIDVYRISCSSAYAFLQGWNGKTTSMKNKSAVESSKLALIYTLNSNT